jgi:cytochrome c
MSCHTLDKDVVGPAFKSVAKRYKGKAQAEEMLVKTVVKGRRMRWLPLGNQKMPSPGARVAVSEEEARVLVRWILAQ